LAINNVALFESCNKSLLIAMAVDVTMNMNMNMNLFNHNNNSTDNYDIVQLNSCGCWI